MKREQYRLPRIIRLAIKAMVAGNLVLEFQSPELLAQIFTPIVASNFSDNSHCERQNLRGGSLTAQGPRAHRGSRPVALHLLQNKEGSAIRSEYEPLLMLPHPLGLLVRFCTVGLGASLLRR